MTSTAFRAGSLFTYFVLALAMYSTKGHFDPGWVLAFSLVFVAWIVIDALVKTSSSLQLSRPDAVAWPVAVLFMLLTVGPAPVEYSTEAGVAQLRLLAGVPLLVLAGVAAAGRLGFPRARDGLLAGMWLTMLAVRLFVLFVSPAPHIDVFVSNTHGADLFLSGSNPYRGQYADIYGGRYDYSPGFVYWPAVLVLQAAARLLFGDIRMASVLADVATWVFSWLMLRRDGGSPLARSAWLLIWFAFPVQLFVLEQSWVDPILIAIVAATMYCLTAGRPVWSAIAVGIGLATKQYFVVFAVLWGIWVLRRYGLRTATQLLLISAGVLALFLAPFLMADADAFLRMTVFVPLRQAFRADSFSLLAYFYREGGPAGSWYALPGALALAAWSARIWRRSSSEVMTTDLVRGAFLVFVCLFLFGKQAFCNYYTFAAFFLWLTIALPRDVPR
jgi:hypothetical protein